MKLKDDIKIDGRNSEDILRQVKAIAPYYTPHLDTLDEDNPGVVLFKIFSQIVEDVVKRLDQVPEKHFIAFLDMLGMGILPPQPSRVPVTFTVSEGADTGIHIPEKTQLGADATDTHPELTFEIEPGRGFLATPSVLKKVYSINPGTDEIFEHLQHLEQNGQNGQKTRTRLFADGRKNDLQEHILYIGHSDLFNIKGQAKIELVISPGISAVPFIFAMTRRRGYPAVRWEYYGEKIEKRDGEEIKKEGWHPLTIPLQDIKNSETTKRGRIQNEGSRPRQLPKSLASLYKIPVIGVRSVGEEFNRRLKAYGITTIGDILKHTPEDLARMIGTSRRRAEIILEEAEVPHLDFDYDYESKHPGPDYTGTDRSRTVLLKELDGEIKEFEINKIKSRWIRCRITNRYALDARAKLFLARLFRVSISSIKVGIQPYDMEAKDGNGGDSGKDGGEDGNGKPRPDMALYNDVPLDLTDIPDDEHLSPFGEIPGLYDSFYIASSDAFSKKDADITITFRISRGTPTKDLRLSWEYWNGKGWAVIEKLRDNTDRFTFDGDTDGDNEKRDNEKTVTFTCPADFEKTGVGGHENYWIRARIVAGDYGKVKFKENPDKTWQSDTCAVNAPEFTDIRVEYAYKGSGKVPEHIITYNNLDYSTDLVKDGQVAVRAFRPFERLKEKTQSLYLGFDRQLKGGPINIFFSIEEQKYPKNFIPRFRWEYCSSSGSRKEAWARLDVVDETDNLTKRGILSLVAPDDMSRRRIFGEELYWIRARLTSGRFEPETGNTREKDTAENKDGAGEDIDEGHQPCEEAMSSLSAGCADEKAARYPPILKGIHLNTTWAFQTETVTEEILGSSDGTPEQMYFFSKRPVINEEVWVNELSSLSSGEMSELMEKTPSAVMDVKDADGNTTQFWVKWTRVDDFLDSGQEDRHYVLDSTTGTVNFGDGIKGRVPPIGRDNIKTNYQTGGGMAGNIKAFGITSLKSSLPFIDSVTNPEMADGGADTETIDRLVIRGPQHIKNRAHAVAREDFEWIALEASRKVARTKCIPNLDKECKFKPGWVTLIIVPQSSEKRPVPSVGLKAMVMKYIEERCAGVLTASRQFVVRGPDYLGVSISATLITGTIDMIPVIERDARLKVTEFLHPLTGGDMGDGWEFGRLPCLSDFYQILEGIDGVDHVEGLSMEIKGAKKDENIIITPENESYPRLKQYNLVFSGEHDINATVRGV